VSNDIMIEATTTTPIGTRASERGLHAVIVAVGGSIWAFFGLQGLQGWGGALPFIALAVIPIALVAVGLALRARAARMAQGASRFQAMRGRYLTIVRLEYGAIIAAIIICNLIHQQMYLMPIIALIVGIHFFALVPVLQTRSAYVKGALLVLIAILTPLALPQHAHPGGRDLLPWELLPGLATAAVLWIDSLTALISSFRMTKEAAPAA
jgi:hypothetical protein